MGHSESGRYDRPELGHAGGDRLISARGRRAPAITFAALVVIAVALSVAAISFLDGWANWLVLGMIVFTTVGLMIALHTRMN
jgi:hypothetical protein